MNLSKMLKIESDTIKNNEDIGKRNDCKEVLISALYSDNTIHHILPERQFVNRIVEDLISFSDILNKKVQVQAFDKADDHPNITPVKVPKEIVFKNRQAIGDIFTMTAAIRDFKAMFPKTRIGVHTTAMHIWDNNPNIDHTFRSLEQDTLLEVGPGFLTNKSNLWNYHMCNAFRLDIENKLDLRIPQGECRPDIWLTEEEYKRDPIISGDYWVFIYGGEPGWPSKQYHKWQEVIDILHSRGITVVQLGVLGHPYPVMNNAVNFIGKTQDRETGIRDLFNIFLHSQGSMGLVSMHMHLSAAFGNPCVTLAAGREPAWFTQYYGHQYIQTNGTMACCQHKACWACKIEGCKNHSDKKNPLNVTVPKCVEIIEPEEVAEAVMKYYKGGRLLLGKKIPNTFFNNIVKEKKVFVVPQTTVVDEKLLSNFGFKWGGGCITDRDWLFMKDVIEKYKVHNILEFGAGLSSLLFGTIMNKVITFETKQGWIKEISAKANEKVNEFFLWDGKHLELDPEDFTDDKFDMAFVDGPAGGSNREFSTMYASKMSDIVIVHDAGREWEKKWAEKHLSEFKLVSKGGHRCHLWVRAIKADATKKEEDKIIIENSIGKPIAKMITTCRGYGGSERSTIEIMDMFQKKGYHVQLCPTGSISGEYQKNIPKGVQIANWDDMAQYVDIAVLYASDTIWNYTKPQYEKMSDLNAKRKVMVLNFKVGDAGKVPWTIGWDKYLFLSSLLESELVKRIPNAKTKVMAPPTDLTLFFKNEVNYDLPLRLIRHSSQGDNKYADFSNKMIQDILEIDPTIQFHFMPAKSDCITHPNVFKYAKNQPPVYDFLKEGSVFFYSLPIGYTEGGPKVILESMASGIPVICDNHSGMKDRVTNETGWKCDKYEDYLEVIKEIISNPEIIKIKGIAAKERAKKEFTREKWIEEIIS